MHSTQFLSKKTLWAIAPVAVLLLAFVAIYFIIGVWGAKLPDTLQLPLLAIAGVVVLLATLALVSVSFGMLDLTDEKQPLGLPEGSIRAVIALALIVLFAIFVVFLYNGLAQGNRSLREVDVAATKQQFQAANPAIQNLVVLSTDPECANAATLTQPANSSQKKTCRFGYPAGNNPAGEDFAKQMLTLIGTLMTAVVSFYFASKTIGEAQTSQAGDTPTLTGITPATYGFAPDTPLHVEVSGSRLNNITELKLTRAGQPSLFGTGLTSSGGAVKCDIAITAQTQPGPWDVTVTDARGRSANLPGAFTVLFAITGVSPNTYNRTGSSPIPVKIAGSNLATVKAVRLSQPGQPDLAASGVTATDTTVTCDVAISPQTSAGAWDLTATDGSGQSVTMKGALTLA